MNQQAVSPLAHRRENGPIHAHDAEEVDVEDLLHLLQRVRFGHAKASHSGIVDDDIQPSRLPKSVLNRLLYGSIVGDVELQHVQGQRVAGGESLQRVARLRVASLDVPHGREHVVAAPGQPFGRVPSEACAGSGDEYDSVHVGSLPRFAGRLPYRRRLTGNRAFPPGQDCGCSGPWSLFTVARGLNRRAGVVRAPD